MALSIKCLNLRSITAPGMLLATSVLSLGAQVPTIVQIPFATAVAGLPPGSGATTCSTTTDVPTGGGTHLGDGCPALQAALNGPYSSSADQQGNVFIADYNVFALRVVYAGGANLATALAAANPQAPGLVPQAGSIYTLAGGRTATLTTSTPVGGGTNKYFCNGAGSGPIALSSNGDGCPAGYAYIKPRTIAFSKDGDVYFTSGAGSAPIRVVYMGGAQTAALISTLFPGTTPQIGYIYSIIKSSANGYGGDGLLATAATVQTYAPRDVALDSKGNIFLADGNAGGSATNNNIRKVDGTTGIISTFAGSSGCIQPNTTGCPTTTSSPDGTLASAATFYSPYALWTDKYDNVYFAEYNANKVRVIYQTGTVPGYAAGSLTAGVVYTVAGGGTVTGLATANGTAARSLLLGTVQTGGIDAAGNLYFHDSTNKLTWRVDVTTGLAINIAGGKSSTTVGAYCVGTAGPKATDTIRDGCPATLASVTANGHYTVDANGTIYETENGNSLIRAFRFDLSAPSTAVGSSATLQAAYLNLAATTIAGESFTLQGQATSEFSDAGNNQCPFGTALAINTTCTYNIAFAPALAGMRKASLTLNSAASTPLITAFAGGTGVAANINFDPASQTVLGSGLKPNGIGVDGNGNTYISDATGQKVVKITSAGTASDLVTGLNAPSQIAVDGKGNVYVADTGNNRIVMTPAAGGTGTALGTGLSLPRGVAVNALGNVFIADTGNNRVVELPASGGQILLQTSNLSAPGALALDTAGNLFVADTGNNRIVELPFNGNQTSINLGSSPISPNGIALDPAGDIYVADLNSQQILFFAAGATTSSPVVTGLGSPNGLAVAPNGSVFVSDASAIGGLAYNRANPTITYSPTNFGDTSSDTVTVTNTGNAALTFNGAALFTTTGDVADFSIVPASSNGCALGVAVSSSANCALTASFSPLSTGNFSEVATPVTNAANTASAGLVLKGTGVNLIRTTTALTITQPTTSTISYGQTVVLQAKVTPNTGTGTPTGTVKFTIDGVSQPLQTLGASLPQVTVSPAVGIHSIGATYSGDTLNAGSSTSLSFTVQKAATTTALAVATSTVSGAPSTTFTATVSSATATGMTGLVTFYSGTTAIGTAQVANGTAIFTTSVTTFTSYTFSATYAGDANFLSSTSTFLSPSPDYVVSPASTTVSIPQGGVATTSLLLTSVFNYSGTISATCSDLPAYASCAFSPRSASISPGNSQTVQMQIFTNIQPTLAAIRSTRGEWLALLCPSLLAWTLLRRKRAAWRALALVLCAATLGAAALLTGCSEVHAPTPVTTPTGTTAIQITFTDSTGAAKIQKLNFTVLTP